MKYRNKILTLLKVFNVCRSRIFTETEFKLLISYFIRHAMRRSTQRTIQKWRLDKASNEKQVKTSLSFSKNRDTPQSQTGRLWTGSAV